MADLTIALAGNPNVGKSTVFNALTGMRQHVGNWPGKTVERKEGQLTLGTHTATIVDLPGTYSLTARSLEEQIARDFIIRERPDAVVNVLDVANLERNLYLTAQLLEMEVPLVLVLNMVDVADARGLKLDQPALAAALGVPVVMMAASRGQGMDELKRVLSQLIASAPAQARGGIA
ncbi:small GTP-binding protein [Oscillochloris trichoides DG-6]|uniref:Fe(2+) transporter FeoB n=1 Tax=Oscillochloris trichoides DG-6 TaxID=765420 RepID=E1ICX5_9CHLR|nr:FeoB small GTPase domain-containing protein [Oscillochloris trichoides]EFO80945.1 small GTP-binding protein [Oscillochloris trichoides DG-6]